MRLTLLFNNPICDDFNYRALLQHHAVSIRNLRKPRDVGLIWSKQMKTLTLKEYAELFHLIVSTDHDARKKEQDNDDVCHLCIIKEKLRVLAGEALAPELRINPKNCAIFRRNDF